MRSKGWPSVQIRRLFKIQRGATPRPDEEYWGGPHVWITPEDLAAIDGGFIADSRRRISDEGLRSCSAALTPPGSLVVSSRAPIGYLAQTETWSCTNQGCFSLVPRVELDPRYFRYQLVAGRSDLESLGQGSTFLELSTDAFATSPVDCPPVATQRAIADFLDRETARINGLVAKKGRLLRVLEDLLESMLARALRISFDAERQGTRVLPGGLEASPDSEVLSLKQAGVRVCTGPFGTQFSAHEYVADGIPMINPTHIKNGRVVPDANATVAQSAAARLSRHATEVGDIVLGRKGDVGRSALITLAERGWIVGSDSIAIRAVGSRLLPEYLDALLQLDIIRQQLEATSTGATLANVNESTLLRLQVPVPSRLEQSARVREAKAVRRHDAELRQHLRSQIQLIEEHRQALITTSVTSGARLESTNV